MIPRVKLLLIMVSAFVLATTVAMWNASSNRLGLAVAATFVIVLCSAALFVLDASIRLLKRKRPHV